MSEKLTSSNIEVTVHVRNIHLLVRFSCKLSVQLKIDSKKFQGGMHYRLADGKCTINEKLVAVVRNYHRDGKLTDQKISCIIMMTSAMGTVPAGAVTLKVAQEGQIVMDGSVQLLPVSKCPDKQAMIELSCSARLLPDSDVTQKQDEESTQRPLYLSNQSAIHIREDTSQNSQNKPLEPYYDKNSSHAASRESSAVKAPSIPQINRNKRANVYQSNILNTMNTSSNRSLHVSNNKSTNYLDRSWRKNEEDRNEMNGLVTERNQYKFKYQQSEKKETALAAQVRQLKRILEKGQQKINVSQRNIIEHQSKIQDKEYKVKALEELLKASRQEIDQLKIKLNIQEKKVEYREKSLQEHVDKLTEKCILRDRERQNVTEELNKMINDHEKKEKRNHELMKDKDRQYLEQKSAILKKQERLIHQMGKLSEENENLKRRLEQFQNQSFQDHLSQDELQKQNEKFRQDFRKLEDQIQRLKNINMDTEKELNNLLEQRQNIHKTKKQNEKNHLQSDQKLKNIQIRCAILEDKVVEQQKTINQQNKQKQELQNQINDHTQNIKILTLKIELLKNEKESLASDLDQSRKIIVSYKLECEKQKAHSSKLNEELTEISSSMSKLTSDSSEIQFFIDDMRAQLQAKEKENSNLLNKLGQFQNMDQHYESEIQAALTEIADLKSQITSLVEQIQSLRRQLQDKKLEISHLQEQNSSFNNQKDKEFCMYREQSLCLISAIIHSLYSQVQLSIPSFHQYPHRDLLQQVRQALYKNFERLKTLTKTIQIQQSNLHYQSGEQTQLITEYQQNIMKLEEQVDMLRWQCRNLSNKNKESYELTIQGEWHIKQLGEKIVMLQNQLKMLLTAWEDEKQALKPFSCSNNTSPLSEQSRKIFLQDDISQIMQEIDRRCRQRYQSQLPSPN